MTLQEAVQNEKEDKIVLEVEWVLPLVKDTVARKAQRAARI